MKSHTTDISEDEIMRLIQSEHTKSQGFTMLVKQYQKPIYVIVRRMTHNHEDTDDVLQNVFIKVYKHIEKFEHKSKLSTWLYRIAVNETNTFLSSKKKKRLESLADSTSYNVRASQGVIDGNAIENLLLDAIKTLPEKQKIVFNLRYYNEMTYKQMSDVLGTSIGALKASFHHAVKKIEKHVLANEWI